MKVTELMIDRAIEAYATKRHPDRWDGVPWGECGTMNHRLAITEALIAALETSKRKPTSPNSRFGAIAAWLKSQWQRLRKAADVVQTV